MSEENDKKTAAGCGVQVAATGSSLAVVLSWTAYKSFGWAVLHGFCGWLYVVYVAFLKHHL